MVKLLPTDSTYPITTNELVYSKNLKTEQNINLTSKLNWLPLNRKKITSRFIFKSFGSPRLPITLKLELAGMIIFQEE